MGGLECRNCSFASAATRGGGHPRAPAARPRPTVSLSPPLTIAHWPPLNLLASITLFPQVQHFDRLHDKEQALVLTLHASINRTPKDAAGSLGGRPQAGQ